MSQRPRYRSHAACTVILIEPALCGCFLHPLTSVCYHLVARFFVRQSGEGLHGPEFISTQDGPRDCLHADTVADQADLSHFGSIGLGECIELLTASTFEGRDNLLLLLFERGSCARSRRQGCHHSSQQRLLRRVSSQVRRPNETRRINKSPTFDADFCGMEDVPTAAATAASSAARRGDDALGDADCSTACTRPRSLILRTRGRFEVVGSLLSAWAVWLGLVLSCCEAVGSANKQHVSARTETDMLHKRTCCS